MSTCAIVVTFNRLALLKECIKALQNQTKTVNHIVIVNNNSTDGTKSYLDTINDDKFINVHMEKNLGGAGGFSKGLEVAVSQTKDENFWILDDDTIVDENANQNFLQHDVQLDHEFAFLISNVRWTDGSPANVMAPNENWPDKIEQNLVQVNYGTFVSFFVNRDNVLKYGLPIAEFFIWGDDAEYSLRLQQNNKAYFMTDVKATHKSAGNVVAPGVVVDTPDRINRYYYYYRNQMYIYKHYYKKEYKKVFVINLVKVISVFVKAKDNKFKRAGTALKGLMASVKFNPQIKN